MVFKILIILAALFTGFVIGATRERVLSRPPAQGEYEDFIKKYCSWQPARQEWKVNYGRFPKYYKSSGLYDAFLHHRKS